MLRFWKINTVIIIIIIIIIIITIIIDIRRLIKKASSLHKTRLIIRSLLLLSGMLES